MIQDPKIEYRSRGYEIEVRNLDTGRSIEILLEARAKRWVVKADKFFGSYSSLESAITEALGLLEKALT